MTGLFIGMTKLYTFFYMNIYSHKSCIWETTHKFVGLQYMYIYEFYIMFFRTQNYRPLL